MDDLLQILMTRRVDVDAPARRVGVGAAVVAVGVAVLVGVAVAPVVGAAVGVTVISTPGSQGVVSKLTDEQSELITMVSSPAVGGHLSAATMLLWV